MADDIMDKTRAAVCWANNVPSDRADQLRAFFGTVMPDYPQDKVEAVIKSLKNPQKSCQKPAEEVLISVRRAFEAEALIPLLERRKEQVPILNAGVEPCIDKNYWCETCGSTTGECHPDTGYCFICDTDNWEPYNNRGL